jgi:hypothetical protein
MHSFLRSSYSNRKRAILSPFSARSQPLARNQLIAQENKILQLRMIIMATEPRPAETGFDFFDLPDTDFNTGLKGSLNAELNSDI